MRLFRALCATLGALLIVSTLPSGAYAADGPTLSETFVLTKDGQLVDTLTIIDPSRTMSESAGKPYAGKSSDQHVEFVTRDDATVCHMQLMYTNAERESEFSLEDSGEFVMTAHAERTLTESRKLFHPDLTLKSLSLSVEGEVQSSASGASTSATTYEGRTFSVTSRTDTVPQMITVKGSLTPGGDPGAAATTNALKYPWGVTPMPASASASPSAAPTADTAATPGSSDPPIALLVGLIVGLILLVIGIVVVVYVVRAKRGKKATSGTQGAAPATQVRRPSPSRGNEGGVPYAPPAPNAPAPAPTAPSTPTVSSTGHPSASLNPRSRRRVTPVSRGSTSRTRNPPPLPQLRAHRLLRGDTHARTTGLWSSPSALPSRSPVSRCLPLAYPAAPSRPQWLTLLSAPRPRLRPLIPRFVVVRARPRRLSRWPTLSRRSQAGVRSVSRSATRMFLSLFRPPKKHLRHSRHRFPCPSLPSRPCRCPPSAVDAPETMLIPKVRQADIRMPEPVVEPEPVAEPEPEIDKPIDSSHAPMISVDAQDEDDWNDWQNWNSRS